MVTTSLVAQLLVGAAALFVLVKSAELAVSRALALATHYDVPDVVVGMTVLAIGTSLPEIASHVIASAGERGRRGSRRCRSWGKYTAREKPASGSCTPTRNLPPASRGSYPVVRTAWIYVLCCSTDCQTY